MAELEKQPNEAKLFNRSLIFLHEAQKRKLDVRAIKIFGHYTRDFRLFINGKNYDYHEIPLLIFSKDITKYDGKDAFKNFLQIHQLPHAEGKNFCKQEKAIAFGIALGFPLVVKPNDGSLSAHATYPIHDLATFSQAIEIAQQFQPKFVVERYITGNLYRATVIGRKRVFVCQREAANVVGDGRATIRQLIEKKNDDPNRAASGTKNSTLHRICIDQSLEKYLDTQGLSLETVPLLNQKIHLSKKAVLSAGSDIISCSDRVHSDNTELFINIARLLGTDLVGIDFITPDISSSYLKQISAVLEINTLPYIDMHQHPSHGQSDPVAQLVWDEVMERLQWFHGVSETDQSSNSSDNHSSVR